ncbi:hypothetical protein FGRMN_1269 [Fusarium graminum]|nr:hypothetical protein FGRMN_1269 [Fusarium graminum]
MLCNEKYDELSWILASKWKDVILIDALLAHGEDLEAQDNHGRTVLHLAAEIEDDNDTVRALVDAGSDLSVEDDMGDTPLAIAIVNGSVASVKFLLRHGPDLGELDENNLEQCGREKPEIAVYLRGLGLDVPVDVDSDTED